MNSAVKFRLIALGLAVGLMGALIVVLTLNSQRQARDLRTRLNHVDSESFGIAERFKDSVREVNNTMLHYGINHEATNWDHFLSASHELGGWLEAQSPKLTTTGERQVFREVNAAYDDYRRLARELHDQIQVSGENSASLAEFARFLAQAQRLFDLGHDLAQAHYESRNQLLTHAQQSLTDLRWSVLGLLGLLFLFGLALAALVYRDLIAPLHVKLVESQSRVERREKLAALGMLAAGVAHEIRNPLTAIKAALFLQQKKFAPGSPEAADAQVVEREILRLEKIVNDFLQFARPTEPQWATLSADVPLQEVQLVLASQLAKARIRLVLEKPAPMHLRADPAQIKQVLINLVRNAADSIDHDGTITLRARSSRQILAQGETDVVILEVADTGRGIPPDVEKRLFDPFFSTKDTGTGLGLSIAARIVQQHGGALQYQTQVNRGTTFGIVLPRAG